MSRIGNNRLQFRWSGSQNAGPTVSVKGPLGKLDWSLVSGIEVAVNDGHVVVDRSSDDR